MRLFVLLLVLALTGMDLAAQQLHASNDTTQPVVDVRALARQQIEMAKNAQRAVPIQPSMRPETANPLLPMAFLMAILLGAIAVLWIVVRKPRPKSSSVVSPVTPAVQPKPPGENPVDALLRQAQLILLEKKAQRTLHAAQRSQPLDTGLALARTFGRGKGELALAQKLQTSAAEYPWQQRIHKDDPLLAGESTAASAKNLGVGTGELRLLHTLQAMQAQQRKETR